MLKRIGVLLGILLVIIGIGFVVLKMNPPLTAHGITYYSGDQLGRSVEIKNNGVRNITIKQLIVDEKIENHAQLGSSTNGRLILGANLEEDPQVKFTSLVESIIAPYSEEQQNHYGIHVITEKSPEQMQIRYTYFMIPFQLTVNVKE